MSAIGDYKATLEQSLGISLFTRMSSDLFTENDTASSVPFPFCQISHSFAGVDRESDLSVLRYKYSVTIRVIQRLTGAERAYTEVGMISHQAIIGDEIFWRDLLPSSPGVIRIPALYDVMELEVSEPVREGKVIWFEATALVRFNTF